MPRCCWYVFVLVRRSSISPISTWMPSMHTPPFSIREVGPAQTQLRGGGIHSHVGSTQGLSLSSPPPLSLSLSLSLLSPFQHMLRSSERVSAETRLPPPGFTFGPYVQSYCRVLGGGLFLVREVPLYPSSPPEEREPEINERDRDRATGNQRPPPSILRTTPPPPPGRRVVARHHARYHAGKERVLY